MCVVSWHDFENNYLLLCLFLTLLYSQQYSKTLKLSCFCFTIFFFLLNLCHITAGSAYIPYCSPRVLHELGIAITLSMHLSCISCLHFFQIHFIFSKHLNFGLYLIWSPQLPILSVWRLIWHLLLRIACTVVKLAQLYTFRATCL